MSHRFAVGADDAKSEHLLAPCRLRRPRHQKDVIGDGSRELNDEAGELPDRGWVDLLQEGYHKGYGQQDDDVDEAGGHSDPEAAISHGL